MPPIAARPSLDPPFPNVAQPCQPSNPLPKLFLSPKMAFTGFARLDKHISMNKLCWFKIQSVLRKAVQTVHRILVDFKDDKASPQ